MIRTACLAALCCLLLAGCAPQPAAVSAAPERETWTGMTSVCIDHAARVTGVARSGITATLTGLGPGNRARYAVSAGGGDYLCEVSGALALLDFRTA
jgi:hypothetical protein